MLKKFLRDRKGTAEVIGSVLSIVILIFFFSNVYLFHDSNVNKMNDLQAQKMNSQITVEYLPGELVVTNVGGADAVLSRLWVVSGNNHIPLSLDNNPNHPLVVKAGRSISLMFDLSGSRINRIYVPGTPYSFTSFGFSVFIGASTFLVLTTLGNIRSCSPTDI